MRLKTQEELAAEQQAELLRQARKLDVVFRDTRQVQFGEHALTLRSPSLGWYQSAIKALVSGATGPGVLARLLAIVREGGDDPETRSRAVAEVAASLLDWCCDALAQLLLAANPPETLQTVTGLPVVSTPELAAWLKDNLSLPGLVAIIYQLLDLVDVETVSRFFGAIPGRWRTLTQTSTG